MPLFWRPFRGFFWADHPRAPGNEQPGKASAEKGGDTGCDTIKNTADNGRVQLDPGFAQEGGATDYSAMGTVTNFGNNTAATGYGQDNHIEEPVEGKHAEGKPALENTTEEAEKDPADGYAAVPTDSDINTSGKSTGSGVVQRPENKEMLPDDQFHMVGPGMYQFSRDFMNSSPGPGSAKGGGNVSYPGAALPTSLNHYIKTRSTRDGMPVYSVK